MGFNVASNFFKFFTLHCFCHVNLYIYKKSTGFRNQAILSCNLLGVSMRFVVIPISTRAVYIHCIRHNNPIAVSAWPVKQSGSKLEYTLKKPNSTNPVFENSTRSTQSTLPTSAIAPNQITLPSSRSPSLVSKVSELWSSFGSSPTQWKQMLVKQVNKLLDRIPFGETALRPVPAKKQVLRKKVRVGKGMDGKSHPKKLANRSSSSQIS